MVTVKIKVDPAVGEYITAKYGDEAAGGIHFPAGSDIYHLLYDLLRKRPTDKPVDDGNVTICLPARRSDADGGKKPEVYNYISERSAAILEARMRAMMWAELHDAMDTNKHIHGIRFKDTVYAFMERYNIQSISEDALLKNYQRWRDKQRRRSKREYRWRK